MAPPRTRARGLCGSLTLVVACCATACFNPSGTDTTASGSTGGPGSTTGSPTTGITSDTTLPGTSTSGTTEVDPTSAGTSTDATTSTTTAPASSTDPSSTGATTVDETTGPVPVCGDNIYVPGVEECDDGNLAPLDSCDADCKRTSFAIFTSAPLPSGAFGGIAEADAICQAEAESVGRQGLYRAWLSDDAESAIMHVQHRPGTPYYLVEGTLIADDWDLLIKNGPMAALNRDVTGATISASMSCVDDLVWTGTDASGQKVAKSNCENWQIALSKTGIVGSFTTSGMNPTWTNCGNLQICESMARLYCFEQPLP